MKETAQDVAEDVWQDVAEDVLGAAVDGSVKVFIEARITFQRRKFCATSCAMSYAASFTCPSFTCRPRENLAPPTPKRAEDTIFIFGTGYFK